MKYYHTNNGFSLLEVLIAIAIVALIAVVSIPLFTIGISSVRDSEVESEELFDIQTKIESDLTADGVESSIRFEFPNRTITIPTEEFEILADIEEENSEVSILYFEFDSERDN